MRTKVFKPNRQEAVDIFVHLGDQITEMATDALEACGRAGMEEPEAAATVLAAFVQVTAVIGAAAGYEAEELARRLKEFQDEHKKTIAGGET